MERTWALTLILNKGTWMCWMFRVTAKILRISAERCWKPFSSSGLSEKDVINSSMYFPHYSKWPYKFFTFTTNVRCWSIRKYVIYSGICPHTAFACRLEASAFACSLARRFGFVLFVAVGYARFFHCSLEVVYFLWPCVGLSTFHTC